MNVGNNSPQINNLFEIKCTTFLVYVQLCITHLLNKLKVIHLNIFDSRNINGPLV